MKQITIIGLLCLALTACEVIQEEDRLIPLPMPQQATTRTHVLIEFTGFRCVNCPNASDMAQSLQQVYDSQLIVVAMHPASNPFTQGKYDYTCPASDVYYHALGGTANTSFPKGNINNEQHTLLEPAEWAAALMQATKESINIGLQINAAMDTTNRQIDIRTTTLADTSIHAQLALWLVEDSILGVQAMPDGSINTNYYHRHILRSSIGENEWGVPIQITNTYSTVTTQYILPDEFNVAYCHVMALIMDNSDRHILQAKATHIDTTYPTIENNSN